MTFTEEAFFTLDSEVAGPVLRRGDEVVAAEVAGQNTVVLHDPEVVVGATSEADVVAAVRFATAHGLPVRVHATGHGAHAPVTDGVLITTSRLSALEIDPATRVAHIGAGTRWNAVVAAAAEHGLAPITGSSGTVGAVGYTLGGGLGPLSRTFGFSSDFARGFRLVTASGEVVSATATEHPELFWALRGGKGGFGVVTSMDFELVPLASFVGGSLIYDAEHIPAVLRLWAGFTQAAPEEATSSVAVIRFPPLDVFPEPLRGRTVIALRYAFVGDPEEAERLFQPFRDVAPALLGRVGEMPAALVATIHDDPTEPGPSWQRGMLLDRVDDGFVPAFLEVFDPAVPLPLIVAEVRHIGGATHRDVPEGSAVGGRQADYTLVMIGAPDPSLFETALPEVAAGVTARLSPWVSAENSINFAGDLAVPGSFEASWPAETFARLAAVRASWDPARVFPYGPGSI